MSNKQWYKDTFDEMMMSEEAIRKVKGIMEKKENKRMRTGFRVAVTMAALAVVFVVSNVAVYAATGSTLVEKGIEQVSVFIDKKKVDVKEIKQYKDKDGNSVYEIEVDDKKGHEAEIRSSWNEKNMKEENMSGVMDVDDTDAQITLIGRELKKEGKKTYLVIGEDEKEIDITKDFADGDAKGKFELDGQTYKYHVSGTVEKYDINIEKKK